MSADESATSTRRHQAGWFDIRNVIGALLLIYGLVLIAMGIFNASDAELARADGINANLWAGLGIAALGVFFLGWAWLRPIVVDDAQVAKDKKAQDDEPPAH
ncbi:MAG: hypothetical protein WAK18_03425 [Nocardioidaceae bacterium]